MKLISKKEEPKVLQFLKFQQYLKRKLLSLLHENWILENEHFKSITEYVRLIEFLRFCIGKRNVSAHFIAETAIENENRVIREQKLRKFRKSNPDTRK